jgi:hypothetical protein
LRVRGNGRDHLRYEQIPECRAGRAHGTTTQTPLLEFLRDPLMRKYGKEWYNELNTLRELNR